MTIRLRPLMFAALLLAALPFSAQQQDFKLDPAQSRVSWTLGDTLHTVHGTFQLKSGVLHFDKTTGVASGELVVDATTGESGSNARDKKMKRDVLEVQKYPTIVFSPQHVTGTVAPAGGSQVQMMGTMNLHGQPHEMTLTVPLQVTGANASADVHFIVPYVQWGLKNPSNFLLHVSETVIIDVHAVGSLTPAATTSQ